MFPLIQSPGTLPDWHDFSSITESGLAIASANSLRTLGFISSGSMDFWMFRFLRWSQAQSSFTAGGTLLPQSLPWEVWEERFVSVDWGKPTGPQASPSLLLSISQLCLSGSMLSLTSLFWLKYLQNLLLFFPLPSSAPAKPRPFWPYSYTTRQHSYCCVLLKIWENSRVVYLGTFGPQVLIYQVSR